MAETDILEMAIPITASRNWHTDMNANLETLDDKTIVALLANDEGALALTQGMVVKYSTTDEGVLQSDTEDDVSVVGVAYDGSIVPGAAGLIVVAGYAAKVLVTGSVVIGNYLTSASTAGYARPGLWYETVFARALSDQAAGECSAIVFQPRRATVAASMLCRYDIGLYGVHLYG